MRNQLTARTSITPEIVYSADVKLDNHSASLHAWSQGRLMLDFGPCSLPLSPQALLELISHLHKAMDAVVDHAEKEGQQ
ncbi:hypothetical protein DNK06_08840 [Pseudomonas daroniae]|uniref:Uncharacterized protein n=1 Tax=Phytopseudomonas daroniae TaxID=2487519 RepID=A0A4Q9QN37_9GAMM|nr:MULTISPECIES: hypothetical protein [Pseudomonas]TBU81206.1 hypothetical protein DNK06_08840 [Pseudomonas daroniae]TBU83730.1 hypothetical protein DNK31_09605 [Pseudomonas sp. FRB 228]TBU89336.1 hypothetical protein DNJ99_16515 [Pseudomonas daroniae]